MPTASSPSLDDGSRYLPSYVSRPEKFNCRPDSRVELGLLLELFRRTVLERRVQPLPVIVLSDEDLQVRPQIPHVLVVARVNLFAFQGLDETLAERIVVGISRAAHTGKHLMPFQQADVVGTGVLHAAIGMGY